MTSVNHDHCQQQPYGAAHFFNFGKAVLIGGGLSFLVTSILGAYCFSVQSHVSRSLFSHLELLSGATFLGGGIASYYIIAKSRKKNIVSKEKVQEDLLIQTNIQGFFDKVSELLEDEEKDYSDVVDEVDRSGALFINQFRIGYIYHFDEYEVIVYELNLDINLFQYIIASVVQKLKERSSFIKFVFSKMANKDNKIIYITVSKKLENSSLCIKDLGFEVSEETMRASSDNWLKLGEFDLEKRKKIIIEIFDDIQFILNKQIIPFMDIPDIVIMKDKNDQLKHMIKNYLFFQDCKVNNKGATKQEIEDQIKSFKNIVQCFFFNKQEEDEPIIALEKYLDEEIQKLTKEEYNTEETIKIFKSIAENIIKKLS